MAKKLCIRVLSTVTTTKKQREGVLFAALKVQGIPNCPMCNPDQAKCMTSAY